MGDLLHGHSESSFNSDTFTPSDEQHSLTPFLGQVVGKKIFVDIYEDGNLTLVDLDFAPHDVDEKPAPSTFVSSGSVESQMERARHWNASTVLLLGRAGMTQSESFAAFDSLTPSPKTFRPYGEPGFRY